jgi:hypothetical protein
MILKYFRLMIAGLFVYLIGKEASTSESMVYVVLYAAIALDYIVEALRGDT